MKGFGSDKVNGGNGLVGHTKVERTENLSLLNRRINPFGKIGDHLKGGRIDRFEHQPADVLFRNGIDPVFGRAEID